MKLQNLSYTQGFILAFTIGFVARLIPELLSFPYPIGWDTVYYAYRISDGALFGYWNDVFSTWLPYGVMILLGNLTRLDPFLLLKIVAPLLYGGASAGVFFVAWKKLDWSVTKSLLTSGFFTFQLAALAVSWQFYRNVFGVMILLFALPFLRSDIDWKGTAGLSVLGLLIAWGHELATVSLFFIVFGLLTLSVWRKEKIPYRLFVAIIPTLIIFFGNFLWTSPYAAPLERNMIWLQDSTWAHPGGLFFLTNYLQVSTPIESYSSYLELLYHVGSLLVLLYAIVSPLIAVGYFRDRVLGVWTFLLLVGSLGCLVVPFSALLLWGRWMLMLVFPFTFFAANGLWKAAKSLEGVSVSKFLGWFKVTKKVGIGLALVSVIVGGLFMTWTLVDGKYGVIGWGGTFKYVPSTMQSSSVPLRDTEGVIKAYEWLNSNMDSDSSLLVHDVFEFWTLLYLNHDYTAFIFDSDLEAASNRAVDEGFSSAYFVWWNEDISWYNLRLSNDWVSVQDYGRISVYKIV
jgi:hypothetical protein